jgi:hypothetical protein
LEQQEMVHRCVMTGTKTFGKTIEVLLYLSMEGLTNLKDSQFPMHGETNLYKLMSRSDPLTSAFLNEKVDFNQLKEQLNNQGLPFSFRETKEGTELFFRVKDQELAKKALERVILDIKKSPKSILKKPGSMTFDEKVAYVKRSNMYKGNVNKTVSKGRGI